MKRLLTPAIFFVGALVVVSISCEKTTTESAGSPEPVTPRLGLLKGTDVMFTGEKDHTVSPQLAGQMTSAFQNNNPYDVYAWFCSKKSLEMLLAQEGCVGIRIYGGLNNDGQFSPVLYGANARGSDLSGGGLSKSLSDSTGIGPMEMLVPCPPYCP